MTEDEFKRHLYKQLEEDKKNRNVLTTQIYGKNRSKKPNKYSNEKPNQKNPH